MSSNNGPFRVWLNCNAEPSHEARLYYLINDMSRAITLQKQFFQLRFRENVLEIPGFSRRLNQITISLCRKEMSLHIFIINCHETTTNEINTKHPSASSGIKHGSTGQPRLGALGAAETGSRSPETPICMAVQGLGWGSTEVAGVRPAFSCLKGDAFGKHLIADPACAFGAVVS